MRKRSPRCKSLAKLSNTCCKLPSLSSTRDNIHELEAGSKGVTGIDIIARVRPDAGFSFVNIAGKPQEPRDRVYEAKWGEHPDVL